MQTIYWLTHDLRVRDNPTLQLAQQQSAEPVRAVYLQDPASVRQMGDARARFLKQTLATVKEHLANIGVHLSVVDVAWSEQASYLLDLREELGSDAIFVAKQAGYYERASIARLAPYVVEVESNTLFSEHQLPFELDKLPTSFSRARKLIEKDSNLMDSLNLDALQPKVGQFSDRYYLETLPLNALSSQDDITTQGFMGGEDAAISHLRQYFATAAPSHYKQTRNALDGWLNSTRFSPWLALGCISPQQVMWALRHYENQHGANESTYWIFFELLWREYFFWYARTHGHKLFTANGLREAPAYTMLHDPQRLHAWQNGQTDFPLVNACMHQLVSTGFMSNRGRQLVASCLVNELQLDWRLGAEFFERHLIDYDVASNWGNWQYLGGVGADPRGLRRFDQDKQQRTYDPFGEFVKRWQGYLG